MPAADRGRRAARSAAYGGIAAGLAVLALLGVRLLPTADLALYAVASAAIALALIELSFRGAALSWLAASAVGALLAGWITAVPFVFFFGPYPLIKAAAESRIPSRVQSMAVKLLGADLLLGLLALVWLVLMGEGMPRLPLSWWALVLLAQPVVVLYDLALTMMVTLYVGRRHPAR